MQRSPQRSLIPYDHVVQALASDGAHQSFRKGILPGGSRSSKYFLYSHMSDHGREVSPVDGISIAQLSLAKIKSAFEISNIRRGCVTCYMDDIQTSRRFGEGQASAKVRGNLRLPLPRRVRVTRFEKSGVTFPRTPSGQLPDGRQSRN